MTARYEYWTHKDGEHVLVRLDKDGRVTGACGPMWQTRIPDENMHNFDYDSQPVYAAWISAHAAEYDHVVT